MTLKRSIILGALLLLLIILMISYFKNGREEKIKQPPSVSPPEILQAPEEQKELKKVVLFFPSERDNLLHPEEREIYANSSVVLEAKQTVEGLIQGSKNGYISPFPPQTRLRELFLTKRGVAHVDFSKDFQTGHLSGSSAEISTIYSVVNSLAYNFKSIRRVFILIEGGEKETLGGHINLSRPFLPQYSLVAR